MSIMTVETHESKFLAAYLKFNNSPVHETLEICDGVNVDVNEDGNLIGIEVYDLLDAERRIQVKALSEKYKIQDSVEVDNLCNMVVLYAR